MCFWFPSQDLLTEMEKSKEASGNMCGPLISRLKSTSLSLLPVCYWPKSVSWPHPKSRFRKVQLAHWGKQRCRCREGWEIGAHNAIYHSCLVIAFSGSSSSSLLLICMGPNWVGNSNFTVGPGSHFGWALIVYLLWWLCTLSTWLSWNCISQNPVPIHGSWLGLAMREFSASFGRSV